MDDSAEDDEWELLWNARIAGLESILGPADEMVGHSPVPFFLGADSGGAADILYFKQHLDGIVAVTSDLIGCEDQVTNDLGNYELVVCHRDDEPWGANIISQLAYYTLEAQLNPGETMDIDSAVPEGSTIAALLFFEYGRFQVLDRPAGLLLCVGITADELEACREGKRAEVEQALKAAQVYPFTDLYRASVLGK